MRSNAYLNSLPTLQWEKLERNIQSFEQAWQRGERPPIESFVPPEQEGRLALLIELVHADQEFHFKAGEAVTAEAYLRRFPELAQDREVVADLLACELQLRQRAEPAFDVDKLLLRFPAYQPELLARIRRASTGGNARGHGTSAIVADAREDRVKSGRSVGDRLATVGESPADPGGTLALASAETSGASDPPAPPFACVPVALGGYRIESILGQGGMGAVYVAYDDRLGRVVALKTMKPEAAALPGAKERFLREARTVAQIDHDNVIPIWQVGEEGGVPYIAMPMLHGESLASRLQRERVAPLGVILKVGREVAEGLAAAHARGLIHRDIKPANVWLEGDPEGDNRAARFRRCKLLDFGLARPQIDDAHLTTSGATVGTPAFMSPEQAAGAPVDFRTDLFSLGVLLYRMATGEQPFVGTSAMAVLTRLATHTPPPPNTKNPSLSTPLSDLIMKLMAKDPADRPRSARETAASLREMNRQFVATKKSGSPVPPAPLPATFLEPTSAPPTPNPSAAIGLQPSPGESVRKPRWDAKWTWAAAILAMAFVALVAGIVVIRVKGPDGKETTVEVPSGSIVKVDPDGRKVDVQLPKDVAPARKPGAADAPARKPVAADPDRPAAEWALERGGKLHIDWGGSEKRVAAAKDLPAGPFFLVRVILDGCGDKVTDDGLKHLQGLSRLTHLYLVNTPVTDAGLKHIKELTTLVDVHLGGTKVTDAGLEHLQGLKGITHLSMYRTEVTNAGLEHLRGLDQLYFLDLDATKVTDDGLKHLKGMSRLGMLSLINTGVTDNGLDHLKGLTAISSLSLDGTAVTDAGLEKLKALPLTHLGVSATRLTDAGLEHLKGMTKLTSLAVGGPRVTNAGLACLKNLDKLTFLSLTGSGLTDAGLEHLEGLANLTELHLVQTNVTPARAENLRKALPNCKVVVLP